MTPGTAHKVHPRIRGEYRVNTYYNAKAEGSPPHTRGILEHAILRCQACRFTPAYAGNTPTSPPCPSCRRVHPRIRGEYQQQIRGNHRSQGSPPHTRGILMFFSGFVRGIRFTPAYAGNTENSGFVSGVFRVHPRIRGEYYTHGKPRHAAEGSPPHTRGIQVTQIAELVNGRFTPAYAGNTHNAFL